MTNVQEALNNTLVMLDALTVEFGITGLEPLIADCKAALAKIEKCEPVGYVDRITLERWQLLKGTEYEAAERGYIGFSKEPFKTKLTDCTLAVFTSPQPIEWVDINLEKYEKAGLGMMAKAINDELKQLNTKG